MCYIDQHAENNGNENKIFNSTIGATRQKKISVLLLKKK
jgi:hypothetical protein